MIEGSRRAVGHYAVEDAWCSAGHIGVGAVPARHAGNIGQCDPVFGGGIQCNVVVDDQALIGRYTTGGRQ